MTNKESFEIYGSSDNSIAILTINDIDATAEDKNKLSAAYGMLDAVNQSDIKIGDTSETLSASARRNLLNQAKSIFVAESLPFPNDIQIGEISGIKWP